MVPEVSVVYVNFNTSDLLIDSILSLERQCRNVVFEVIIVDNASGQKEREKISLWAGEERHYKLNLICSKENLGFSRANNLGASLSDAKYLFFLNPDTIIVNDVLSIFVNFLETAGPETAACGGNLLAADYSPNASYGNFPGLLLELCTIGIGLRFFFNKHYKEKIAIAAPLFNKKISEVPYIVGADIFIKSEHFKNIGGFDENYFMYYEETDLFKRLSKQSLKSFVLPMAEIIHFEGGAVSINSSGNFNYRKYQMLLTSKIYYYRKWGSPGSLWLFKIIFFIQLIIRFLKGKMGNRPGLLLVLYFNGIR